MRLDDRLRGHHQGSEDRWEAMRDLSSRPFCSCDGRRVSLGDLSAAYRYTTRFAHGAAAPLYPARACDQGAGAVQSALSPFPPARAIGPLHRHQ